MERKTQRGGWGSQRRREQRGTGENRARVICLFLFLFYLFAFFLFAATTNPTANRSDWKTNHCGFSWDKEWDGPAREEGGDSLIPAVPAGTPAPFQTCPCSRGQGAEHTGHCLGAAGPFPQPSVQQLSPSCCSQGAFSWLETHHVILIDPSETELSQNHESRDRV